MSLTKNVLGLLVASFVVGVARGAVTIIYNGTCPLVQGATCPDNQYVTFKLYTKLNPAIGQNLDLVSNNIAQSNFNASNPTKIIIHGFTCSESFPLLVTLRSAYFAKGDYNLIMVDWAFLAQGPETCYATAMTNIRHVGECTAQLVQRIRQDAVVDIHVIGHSMGAQMANYIAKYVSPILPRITGLDPAGPFYTALTPAADQLDATDAAFVDVIHTNINVLGKVERCGHADYYLNTGTFQPGCGADALCSHYRSIMFYTESISSTKGFYGAKCTNLASYQLGLCSTATRKVLMGEYAAATTTGLISVPTNSASPFARG